MKTAFANLLDAHPVHPSRRKNRGFALVVSLSMMVLLTVIAVGLLGLSAITLRQSTTTMAQAQAQANARLALMIAIGELQKEMGPDMRVSAESAMFDTSADTAAIDGVAQSRWLSSYNAWGSWLNADYELPEGGSVRIGDTYSPRREQMFRRWLLSLPPGSETDVRAPDSIAAWNDDNSVILVGEGSLGTGAPADQITRAYFTTVGESGRHAWWIGPENHKARIDIAHNPRDLTLDQWQLAQSDTTEVGVGALPGLNALDQNAAVGRKLITRDTLSLADVDDARVQRHFFDLTAHSRGVLASVRTGHLKKDLSLLFELENDQLPAPYRYNPGTDVREPSIRPMSPDLLALGPAAPNRHFQSWTNMRHYYRMYRSSSDANTGSIGTPGVLQWNRGQPYSGSQIPLLYRDRSNANDWHGDNSYNRMPLLAKLTFIYSLKSEPVNANDPNNQQYRLFLVYTPVFTYWNPYNVELRIPDNGLGCLSSTYQVLPMRTQLYLNNTPASAAPSGLFTSNAHSFLRSGNGQEIIFKPGEFRLFSHPVIGAQGNQFAPESLIPGFNPLAYGGDLLRVGGNTTYTPAQRPGVVVQFSHSEWGGNVGYGNTPGSLCHTPFWLPAGQQRDLAYNWNMPVMYQHDWFNLAQTYTPLTPPTTEGIARWSFSDSTPVPVAYAQLVIKGLSQFDYESINWARDWRSRNWIQSPPFNFGSATYISENDTIAQTQRVDSPYVMNFGPMSMAEMPKVVGHVGPQAFLGSGSNPFEKVTAVPALELPTAPLGGLAGFSGMRTTPGYTAPRQINDALSIESRGGNATGTASLFFALAKTKAYQSGVTGPGIGNAFMHPMLARNSVYQYLNNSVSQDPANRTQPLANIQPNDNKVFSDFWDHTLLLNDALWDDYFVSSLADQTRPGAGRAVNLQQNLDRLIAGDDLANTRYNYTSGGLPESQVRADLAAADGYLKAARHLIVDGMFNVNSTSVDAWYALFAGIRERNIVYRNAAGSLEKIDIPSGKRIAISRFNTEVSDTEMDDPEFGTAMPGGGPGWTGVRFLGDDDLRLLAEQCVRQVKLRGPFLNFSEFINRRLSNDDLGLMGALQSAIDFDDASPDPRSINYRYKNGSGFMDASDGFGRTSFRTPQAADGSRFAGIPGYVIQSDLLKPIANTLSVRDDTFRIRAYGDARDGKGNIIARAWCEAIIQRVPEYTDSTNDASVPARLMNADGTFSENPELTTANRQFGRKFRIESFRWLNASEV